MLYVEFPQAPPHIAGAHAAIAPRLPRVVAFVFLPSRLLFSSLTSERFLWYQLHNAIKPEEERTIHWTMVSIDTFASLGQWLR
jgi:hypothetical protein